MKYSLPVSSMILEFFPALLPVCDVGGLDSSHMIALYDVKKAKLDASCKQ
jgi:hypothetical protein